MSRSHRTPFKHSLVDHVLGAWIGSIRHWVPKINWQLLRIVIIDLTSGSGDNDGQEPWFRNTSPGLLAYHGMYHVGVPVHIWLYEMKPNIYRSLLLRLELELPAMKCPSCGGHWEKINDNEWRHNQAILRVVRRDSRTLTFNGLGRGDAVFINNDPNVVTDHAINHGGIEEAIHRGARFEQFWAMGCNVGGLHRLEQVERDIWFSYIDKATGILMPTQAAYLAAIHRDDARWGYLLVSASAWEQRWRDIFLACFDKFSLGPMFASYHSEPEKFLEIQQYLFWTIKERGDV